MPAAAAAALTPPAPTSAATAARPATLPCPRLDCSATFPRRDNMQRHLRLVHPPTTHTCGVCNASLPSADRLAAHAATHDKALVAPLRELVEHERQALARDAELQQLRAAAWRREHPRCTEHGCAVSHRATLASGNVALCCACEKRFYPACMGYDAGLVARGGALVCVPCLVRAGQSPAAALTADRRRQLLYAAARQFGREVEEVPADGWCMLNAARQAAGWKEGGKEALLRLALEHLMATTEGEEAAGAQAGEEAGFDLLVAAAATEREVEDAVSGCVAASGHGPGANAQGSGGIRAAAADMLCKLAVEPSPSLATVWDCEVFDHLPRSLAAVLGCRLEMWRVAKSGRVVRDVFAGDRSSGRAGEPVEQAPAESVGCVVLLRFNAELGLAHYASTSSTDEA